MKKSFSVPGRAIGVHYVKLPGARFSASSIAPGQFYEYRVEIQDLSSPTLVRGGRLEAKLDGFDDIFRFGPQALKLTQSTFGAPPNGEHKYKDVVARANAVGRTEELALSVELDYHDGCFKASSKLTLK